MSTRVLAGSGIRPWLVALVLFSLLGVADSGYLFWKHHRSTSLAAGSGISGICPAGGCDVVSEGEYAEVRGIPVAAFGLIGYVALFALSVIAAAIGARTIAWAIFAISGIGVAVSAFLTYLQVAVIKAICSWCILSAFTMTLIFLVSIVSLGKMRPPGQWESGGQQRAL